MNHPKTKLFAVLAAAAALTAVSAPASAQGYGYGHDRYEQGRHDDHRDDERRYERGRSDGDRGAYNINQRQQQLIWRIDQGVRNGRLSHREARHLRATAYDIARLESRYRQGGLTRWERADLDRRLDGLAAQIRYERRDRDYGAGYYR